MNLKKLNKVISENKHNFIVLTLLIFIHFMFINGLEKITINTFTQNSIIYRPIQKCDQKQPTYCLGMPSGHSEIAVILFLFLYRTKLISLQTAIILIFITGLQRILFQKHTPLQVFVGYVVGLIYFTTYKTLKFNYTALLVCLAVFFVLIFIILKRIEKIFRDPIPSWVCKSMYPKIKEKRNTSLTNKFIQIWGSGIAYYQSIFKLYITWKDLEEMLDILVERIKKTNKTYDCIVGIKTGGAIISDYISKKLNIKNYKIKLSLKGNNCKSGKKISDSINAYILEKKNEKFMVCEGIEDNLENKNVILIDELIASGNTINYAYNYLYKEKKVKELLTLALTINTKHFPKENPLNVNYIYPHQILVWPWGYDN